MKIITVLLGLMFILGSAAFGQDINSRAPDFSAKDLNGNDVKLSDLKGKVVLIDFWASWCVPCKKSMPHLIELYENNKADSLVVIGINVDTDRDKINEFQSSINSVISFPIIFDKDSKIPPVYNVEGMPTTVIVNKEGIIKYKEVGYNSDLKEKLDKTIKDLLSR